MRALLGALALAAPCVSAVAQEDSAEAQPAHVTSQETPRAEASRAQFTSVEYKFEHKRYMFSHEEPGAIAHIAGGNPGDSLPLVVFLHGMNADRDVHLWMGGGPGNLRDNVDQWVRKGEVAPMILAAPTHTRFALAANVMWPDFDLDEFIDTTEKALNGRAKVDRDQVILVGHSGAGCNPNGGIFSDEVRRAASHTRAVVAIDTCLDDDTLPAFADLSKRTRVLFYYQPAWSRPVDELTQICETATSACSVDEISGLHGNPHNTVLPVALLHALSVLLPPPRSSPL